MKKINLLFVALLLPLFFGCEPSSVIPQKKIDVQVEFVVEVSGQIKSQSYTQIINLCRGLSLLKFNF
jgi:hypothetical protein